LKNVFNDVAATVKRATDDMVAAKKVADDMVVAERAAADKMAIDVDAGEKAVSNMAVTEGTTAEVASQDVAESSPTPVVGVKRATILGGSTPPAKCQFRGSWKPRYPIGPAFVLLSFILILFYLNSPLCSMSLSSGTPTPGVDQAHGGATGHNPHMS
jgi:hypothetical protein